MIINLKNILIISFISVGAFFTNNIAASVSGENEPSEIMFFWASGYFAHEQPRPLGGSEKELITFCESIQDLLTDYKGDLTLITTRDDYQYSKGKVLCEHAHAFCKIRPVFLEDLIAAFTGNKEQTIETEETYSNQCALTVENIIKSPDFQQVSDDFNLRNKDLLRDLQTHLENAGAISREASPYIPDYISENDLLRHQIAFFLSQGLKDQGNPAYASDILRFLYPLFFNKNNPYIYIDIDKFNHNMQEKEALLQVINNAQTLNGRQEDKPFLQMGEEIDLIVKNKKIDRTTFKDSLNLIMNEPSYTVRQTVLACYFASTIPFLTNCITLKTNNAILQRIKPHIDFIQNKIFSILECTTGNFVIDYQNFIEKIEDHYPNQIEPSSIETIKNNTLHTEFLKSRSHLRLQSTNLYLYNQALANNLPFGQLSNLTSFGEIKNKRSHTWRGIEIWTSTNYVKRFLKSIDNNPGTIDEKSFMFLLCSYFYHDYSIISKGGNYSGIYTDYLKSEFINDMKIFNEKIDAPIVLAEKEAEERTCRKILKP